ncbi:hypothetical protein [Turneriella parva]|uniref:Uncharacterized protein n=1 Tax=Turneriella parva (strain ATCC BAA-1111 / DSM 21527 / NCTC 11395 / H) TaxID=869212 RepID=I4BA23_TURPD|nr:hypothetical protein [Turneriella parva]AFM14130.1 hypothetical protein Turpa_3493 [Turneriella parva DSM 21527]
MTKKIGILLTFLLSGHIFPVEQIPETLEAFDKEIRTLEPFEKKPHGLSEYRNTFWLEQGNVTKEKIIKIAESFQGKTILGIRIFEELSVYEDLDRFPYVANAPIPNKKAIYVSLYGCLSDTTKKIPEEAKKYKDSTYGLAITLKFHGKYDKVKGLSSIEPNQGFNQIVIEIAYNSRVCIPR